MIDYKFPTELFNEIAVIERNSQFYNLLLRSRRKFISSVKMDPWSWKIIEGIARPFQLAAFLMSYSLLRYSDVIKLELKDLLTGKLQIINQNKTEKPVVINALTNSLHPSLLSLIDQTFPFYHSYNRLSYAIRNISNPIIAGNLIDNNRATHIFRYLRTTYILITTGSYESAQTLLGHTDLRATKCYVPRILINHYTNFLERN